ncbi:MAG: hypothetical protein K2G46_08040, partial [Bacteroidales bacterium]|nr:hypothetical protein [Bacteroidales bacterium]
LIYKFMVKKRIITKLMLALSAMLLFFACSKDQNFNYPMDDLYGKWKGSAVKVDNGWVDITSPFFSKFAFSITFYSDGKYYGEGYFGTGWGTYKAIENTIYTYVDGKEYYKYDVKSWTGKYAELTMSTSSGNSSLDIRVEKQ